VNGSGSSVLLLGGTAEARELAVLLEAAGVDFVSSLAGRVARPRLPVGAVRIGGFGGVPGLTRHLEEFPSSVNGLSRSEREALTAIEAGHSTPVRAFLEVARLQESIFLGDIIFYSYLQRLSGRKNALVTWKDGRPVVSPNSRRAREFVDGELKVTALGREVLSGKRDWQGITTRGRWLGGVELTPGSGGWRWDPERRELVRGKRVNTRKPGKKR